MAEHHIDSELDAIVARYAGRDAQHDAQRYSWLRPETFLSCQEQDRAMLRLFVRAGFADLARLRVLEVGCGSGGNLLKLIHWGFDPANLVGNDLLPERLDQARRRLPAATTLIGGDACALECGGFDIVYASTVFSSILDPAFQQRLAAHMWRMTRPGGGVLWYDFCYDNPRNPDVTGMPIRRVRELFPEGRVLARRVTLAPPISRTLARMLPRFATQAYALVNAVPLLRTHALCWIPKPPARGAPASN